jgi:hypothetical protein
MTTDTLMPDATTTAAAVAAAAAAPRLDLYAPIHKALRRFMVDTLQRVGCLDVADAAEMQATLGQLDALLLLCEQHVHHENQFMHPALEARQPGASQRIAGEHAEHLHHIAALRDEAIQLRAAPALRRPLRALRLYRHLALFVADNFQHMHHEETAHNAALWLRYTDAELAELHGHLLASLSPQEMMTVMRWMVPALTPAERAEMLNGMQAEMPPEAFVGLIGQLREHLDDRAWAKLAPAIGVAQQPGLVHFG